MIPYLEVFVREYGCWRAYVACVVEVEQAAKEGREFTPIYWYYPEAGGTTPVLTMWDMNTTPKSQTRP